MIHDVNVQAGEYSENTTLGGHFYCGLTATQYCAGQERVTGWGIDAGVKFNLQNWWGGFWGAGDDILFTGSYTENAVWYSGLPDGMWGENGQVNGNGQPMYMADAYYNPFTNQWSKPTAWSVSGLLEHHWTPQFYTDLEASIGGLEWSNMSGGCSLLLGPTLCPLAGSVAGPLSKSATTWLIGADLGWNPVTNLNFDLELMYQGRTSRSRPASSGPTILTAKCSSRATGTATRAASPAVSASPVTSDRKPIGWSKGPGAKAPGFFLSLRAASKPRPKRLAPGTAANRIVST